MFWSCQFETGPSHQASLIEGSTKQELLSSIESCRPGSGRNRKLRFSLSKQRPKRGALRSLEKEYEIFFRTKGLTRIFNGFLLKTKGFLPKVYGIFGSEMPLGPKYEEQRVNSVLCILP